MRQPEQESCIDKIYGLIENNQLDLPTLPDVANKVRNLVDDPNVSADRVVAAVSSDPAITAQIVRAANSAAFAGKPPVENVRAAVARLGYKQLRNIVMAATLSDLLQVNNPLIKKHMEQYWSHSREVAATSYVLALHQKHLNPDQALLAGLIHDIGTIPLYRCVDKELPAADENILDWLLREFKVPVGIKLLQSWNFPQDMINVLAEHENLQRGSGGTPQADYADVVTVANMQDRVTAKFAAWENIQAAKRLGMTPEECRNFLERFASQLAVAADMLGIGPGTQEAVAKPTAAPPALQPADPPRTGSGLIATLRKKLFE